MPHFTIRRTTNPAADLARGWSAWGGQYEVSPLSLADVDNVMSERSMDEYDVINALDDHLTVETEEGWEIVDSDEARESVAEWVRDELNVDVQRCPSSGLYAIRHHDGLSSYEIDADSAETAIEIAKKSTHNFLTGGVRAIGPVAYYPTSIADVYVFECREIGTQADS